MAEENNTGSGRSRLDPSRLDPTNVMAESADKTRQSVKGLTDEIKLSEYSLTEYAKTFRDSISPSNIFKTKLALEDLTLTLTRETLGQTKVISEGIETAVAKATQDTSLYGINVDDNLRLMKEINEVMEVNTLLSSEQITNMQLLARSSGAASKDIATMVKGFRDLGIGTDEAITNIHNMGQQARSYGINVSQFMGKISENLKKLSSYNFRDGIKGFTEMVAKAQALRIDVGNTFKMAQDLMDPEKAIEMAAGFQMVGGAVGSLGDPFKLLHMAQTDVAGLQDELLKASESAVTFNEETGEFDIPVSEMYRLREMAQMTGQSYEDMADQAIKAKQRTEKLKLLENAVGGYTEEQKELIANLSEIGPGGQLQVKLPGMDEMVDATSLTKEQLAELDELQQDQAKSAEEVSREIRDINKEQLSNLQIMAGTKAQIGATALVSATETPLYGDMADVMGSFTEQYSERVSKLTKGNQIGDLGKTLTQMVDEGFSNPETIKAYATGYANMIASTFGNVKQVLEQTDISLEETNVFKNKIDNVSLALSNLLGIDLDTTNLGTQVDNILNQLDRLYIEQNTEQSTERSEDESTSFNTPLKPDFGDINNETSIDNSDVASIQDVEPLPLNTTITNDYAENSEQTSVIRNISEGEVKVNGTINLSLNNTNMEKIDFNQLLASSEFKSQVLKIVSGTQTTYG